MFYNSTYYKNTGNGFLKTFFNKGRYGEYLIYKKLRKIEREGARFLFNVYVPVNGQTSEIDVLLICSKGVFVFESKNYSGWIFGSENSNFWTQTLPQGKGKSALKEKFYNPIFQNNSHILALQRYVHSDFNFIPVVVFSERCSFKTSMPMNVIKRSSVKRFVLNYQSDFDYSVDVINSLYDCLFPLSQVSSDVKREHIENIKKKY